MPVAPQVDEKNRPPVTFSAFAINTDYEVKATGFKGTATAGAETNVDFLVHATEDRYINGIKLILKNHADGDTLDLKIVDVDGNIPAPARGAFPTYPVLKQFGYDWNVDESEGDQGGVYYNFLARIPASMYLRIVYKSTGAVDVVVKLNANLYLKVVT